MNLEHYVSREVEVARDLAIEEVHDCLAGAIVKAKDVLPKDDESLHVRRREIVRAIQEFRPLYLCALCSRPVYLALASLKRRAGLHFRHLKEDGDCAARTRSGKTQEQIEAGKYDGLKEGPLHRETKQLLVASLASDPDFTGIEVERRWTSKDGVKWRQPDVRAMFRGKPVVFEIQLATTFLSVIESRSRFYLSEGARLVWVFRSFQTENRPAAVDDIYFGNNRNAFVVSPETCAASKGFGQMMMSCHWPQPEMGGEGAVEVWKEKLVAFAEVQTDAAGREWYFDCDRERKKLRPQLFKRRIRSYCADHDSLEWEEREARWIDLVERATALGFRLPDRNGARLFRKLMSGLFSLEEGKPVGFAYPVLISVAHHFYDSLKRLLYYFLWAENAFGRREQLSNEGTQGVWEKRREIAKAGMKRGAPFEADKTHDELVRLLFPEVGALIDEQRKKKQALTGTPLVP